MAAREEQQGQGQRVKRVALPSGKTIEVVYFNQPQPEPRPVERQDLHLCSDCDSQLVYPTQWREVERCTWEVSLRCPNCEWEITEVYDQDTVERFDEELDRGTDSLVDDLKRLVAANMEEEIDRFSTALEGDHILPEDF
jgi:phage-related protein